MYKILLLLLLLFSCIDKEEWNACNPNDSDSECYMPPPEANIRSYNPHSIIISDSAMNVNENVKSIELIRITDGIASSDTFSVVPQGGTYFYVDSVNLDKTYEYQLFFKGYYDDISLTDNTTQLFHNYEGVDNLVVNIVNESEVDVVWNYDYFDYFEDGSQDSITFKLTKYQLGEINDKDTSYISLSFPINNNITQYTYNDTSVNQDDQLKYSIYMLDGNLLSEVVESQIETINFPECNINHHIPLNSHSIYLKWECDYVVDRLAKIQLSNQFNDEIFSIENADPSGYYKDDLNDYIDMVSSVIGNLDELPDTEISYTLTWWGEGGGSSFSTKTLKTFPVHHMEYVPSLDYFNFGDSEDLQNDSTLYSTRAFYIDKYEINSELYENPESNPYEKWGTTPISGGVSYQTAINFINLRTAQYEDLEFHLPNELDWEIAASAKYSNLVFDEEQQNFAGTFLYKYIYPESVGNGQINCLYANIQSCFNNTTEIGFFSDLNGQINSISPSGIYDCSGNVKEWVKKHFNHSDTREILRGGDYNSNPDDVKSTSFIYESPIINHNSIGFRTIIYADEFLESVR